MSGKVYSTAILNYDTAQPSIQSPHRDPIAKRLGLSLAAGKLDRMALPQSASPFLNLPAELRNRIYEYYFAHLSSSSHSLALLLTCRRVYNEAHILAFSNTTFVTTTWVRYKLAAQAEVLRPETASAITSVAFASHLIDWCKFARNRQYLHADFLANVVTLFPGLKRVVLFDTDSDETPPFWWPNGNATKIESVVRTFASGQVMAWTKNEPWEMVWPEDEESESYTRCVVKRKEGEYFGASEVEVSFEDGKYMDEEVAETWWQIPAREMGLGFLVDKDATLSQKVIRSRRKWERQRIVAVVLLSPLVLPVWMGKKARQAWGGR